MGLIWDALSALAGEDKSSKKNNLEKEMDYYGLDEEERELVRKGDYDPWNFEYKESGEELDEDDYYSESDDLRE